MPAATFPLRSDLTWAGVTPDQPKVAPCIPESAAAGTLPLSPTYLNFSQVLNNAAVPPQVR